VNNDPANVLNDGFGTCLDCIFYYFYFNSLARQNICDLNIGQIFYFYEFGSLAKREVLPELEDPV
jgi:hypothetical protein